MKVVIICLCVLALPTIAFAGCPVALSSTLNGKAQALATAKLNQFLVCQQDDPMNDQSPCNTFASRGLESVYGITDFRTATGHKSANDIAQIVATSGHWLAAGPVFDESNNLCAQALANQGYAVIAVMRGAKHGHIALIIPGQPGKSETWNFIVANSAGFLLNHPENAYVGGLLSRAFGPENAKQATFYYRQPDGSK